MKTTVDLHDFREAFRTMGRTDNFSREGLEMLFDYLEQYESGSGEELELDVVGICCDFYEQDARDIAAEYDLDVDLADTDEAGAAEMVAEALQDQTNVIGTTSTGAVIYQAF